MLALGYPMPHVTQWKPNCWKLGKASAVAALNREREIERAPNPAPKPVAGVYDAGKCNTEHCCRSQRAARRALVDCERCCWLERPAACRLGFERFVDVDIVVRPLVRAYVATPLAFVYVCLAVQLESACSIVTILLKVIKRRSKIDLTR